MQKTRNPNPKIQPDRAPAERSPSNKITLLSFRKRPSSAPCPPSTPNSYRWSKTAQFRRRNTMIQDAPAHRSNRRADDLS